MQAFGTGDFDEDEDNDIYKQDTMDSYNFDLGGKIQKDTKMLLNKSYGFGAFESDVLILKKFIQSENVLQPAVLFPGPEVPAGFNCKHQLGICGSNESGSENDAMNLYLKTASARGELLGEQELRPDSVLDLVSPANKQFLIEQRLKQQFNSDEQNKSIAESNKETQAKRYETFISYVKRNYQGELY